MFWLLRGTDSPYFIGPGTPNDRTQILQAAFGKAYEDPEFEKEYKKAIGDDASPINPEDYQIAIREIPRDPEIIELYKKFSGGDLFPIGSPGLAHQRVRWFDFGSHLGIER